jgi:predicted O-linked N-acetylglucosamine transferase (SPINDLY family)
MSTTAAAQRIQADESMSSSTCAAGARPAPMYWLRPLRSGAQGNWHHGGPIIDYFIGDSTVIPPEHAGDFAEAVVTMPGSYIPTDNRQEIATAPSRAECALPDDAVVYCCFNTNYKIEPVIFGAWMEVLRAVPSAVLWLIRSNDAAERNLRLAAQKQGVDPARLVFAPRLPKARHLARHAHADLFLDTHFVNAYDRVDALWAGMPVLTWPGRSFVAVSAPASSPPSTWRS